MTPGEALLEGQILHESGLHQLLLESGSHPAEPHLAELVQNTVQSWSVKLRYRAHAGDYRITVGFLAAAGRLVQWLESRAVG